MPHTLLRKPSAKRSFALFCSVSELAWRWVVRGSSVRNGEVRGRVERRRDVRHRMQMYLEGREGVREVVSRVWRRVDFMVGYVEAGMMLKEY